MRRVLWLVLGLAQFFLLAPASAAPSCASDTLANYIALGAGGCTVGGVTFDSFTEVAPVSGASQITSDAVTLTPISGAGFLGFAFSSGTAIVAGAGDLFELWFGFRASAELGSGLTGNTIELGTPTVAGDGAITMVEQKCLEGVYDTSAGSCASGTEVVQIVFANAFDSDLEEAASFAPASFFDVFIDLVIDGGPGGSAQLGSALGEFRVTASASSAPEPTTVALLGLALLALVLLRHSRRRR